MAHDALPTSGNAGWLSVSRSRIIDAHHNDCHADAELWDALAITLQEDVLPYTALAQTLDEPLLLPILEDIRPQLQQRAQGIDWAAHLQNDTMKKALDSTVLSALRMQ